MRRRVSRVVTVCLSALCASFYACGVVEDETSTGEQAGSQLQGSQLQGSQLQGSQLQGVYLLGFNIAGATLGGAPLQNLRVENGELVAEQNGGTLHGSALELAELQATVQTTGNPPTTTTLAYKIFDVEPEDAAKYDPTGTGSTFLYTLKQWDAAAGAWVPACPPDADGRQVAIPIGGAVWNSTGARVASSTMITLGCTTGVIAKCYRWGYRPWITGYGDMATMHQACTRLARADYCGDGVSHTTNGTEINVWDTLMLGGQIQQHGGLTELVPVLPKIFEGAWDANGAVCLSHDRWIKLESLIRGSCPGNRLIPTLLTKLTCSTSLTVRLLYPGALFMTESLNLDPI
jgi:hypothetical protein